MAFFIVDYYRLHVVEEEEPAAMIDRVNIAWNDVRSEAFLLPQLVMKMAMDLADAVFLP